MRNFLLVVFVFQCLVVAVSWSVAIMLLTSTDSWESGMLNLLLGGFIASSGVRTFFEWRDTPRRRPQT